MPFTVELSCLKRVLCQFGMPLRDVLISNLIECFLLGIHRTKNSLVAGFFTSTSPKSLFKNPLCPQFEKPSDVHSTLYLWQTPTSLFLDLVEGR